MNPILSRVLVATAGAATAAAAMPTVDWRVGLALLGAWLTGVASYNIKGKVTAP